MEQESTQHQEIAQEQASEQGRGVRTRKATAASIVAMSGKKGVTPVVASTRRTAPSLPLPQVAQANQSC